MFLTTTKFSSSVISVIGKFNPHPTIPFSWIDDSIINFYNLLFFSSLWFVCFLFVIIDLDSVAFWNFISFFVEVVATCFISLSTWACNLLGFVIGLLLLGLHVGYFDDLKIIVFEGLFWHSALLLMATTNFITINFLVIQKMSLLSELLQCNSWGIVSSPPPSIFLIPFNKSCFVEPCILNFVLLLFVWSFLESCPLPST
jgi:hypothetical protein